MNKLRAARKSKKLTLIDVAKRINTDAGHLSRIERGQQMPGPRLAKRLSSFYAISLDDIYENIDTAA